MENLQEPSPTVGRSPREGYDQQHERPGNVPKMSNKISQSKIGHLQQFHGNWWLMLKNKSWPKGTLLEVEMSCVLVSQILSCLVKGSIYPWHSKPWVSGSPFCGSGKKIRQDDHSLAVSDVQDASTKERTRDTRARFVNRNKAWRLTFTRKASKSSSGLSPNCLRTNDGFN